MTAAILEIPASRFGEDQSPFLSARRVAELLGVTLGELAGLIGVAQFCLTALLQLCLALSGSGRTRREPSAGH